MELTLAEELTLLAYDDDTGKSKADMYLEYGIGGALLAELALRGAVTLAEKKVTVVDETPAGDPLLDDALAKIAASTPRRPQHWVDRLHRGAKKATLARLVERGLLREESGKVLLVIPFTTYPAEDGGPEREVRQRLHDAVVVGTVPQPRTATLAMLVGACEMGKHVFPEVSRRDLKRKLNDLAAGDWAAAATKKVIDTIRAAVLTTVTTTAATAGTSNS